MPCVLLTRCQVPSFISSRLDLSRAPFYAGSFRDRLGCLSSLSFPFFFLATGCSAADQMKSPPSRLTFFFYVFPPLVMWEILILFFLFSSHSYSFASVFFRKVFLGAVLSWDCRAFNSVTVRFLSGKNKSIYCSFYGGSWICLWRSQYASNELCSKFIQSFTVYFYCTFMCLFIIFWTSK